MALQDTYSAPPRVRGTRSLRDRLGRALAMIDSAITCAKEVESLMALSDDDLARRGLSRQQIVEHAAARHL